MYVLVYYMQYILYYYVCKKHYITKKKKIVIHFNYKKCISIKYSLTNLLSYQYHYIIFFIFPSLTFTNNKLRCQHEMHY